MKTNYTQPGIEWVNSIPAFIKDIKNCLKNDNLWGALALALILPDICGKVEDNNKLRYIRWYDKYVTGEKPSKYPDDVPFINGDLIYKLRCAFLHSGSNDPFDKRESKSTLDDFIFAIGTEKCRSCQMDSISITNPDAGKKRVAIEINLRGLCNDIADAAQVFFENKKEYITHKQKIKTINEDERTKFVMNDFK